MNTERYERQIILNGFGIEAQERLSQAKVLVIGAGGLGCPALQYLVAAGVGCIGIADHDRIDLSNLQRQVLYSTADIGLLKTEVATKRLHLTNPEVKLIPHPIAVEKENVLELISTYDIIFDGTDNFESRYLINDACALLRKPLIFAAVSGYEGQLAVFNVPDQEGISTNYRDLFPIQPVPGEIPNCAESGILGVVPGIIGTMAAGEIIKIISGSKTVFINKLLHYNLLTQEQYVINISPSAEHQSLEIATSLEATDMKSSSHTYLEIDIQEMERFKNDPSALIVDVRERHEFPKLNTEIYTQIPMSEFNDFAASEIGANSIVLLCQHGIRSVAAAELLHQKFGSAKKIYSLKGGIAKWRNHFLKKHDE